MVRAGHGSLGLEKFKPISLKMTAAAAVFFILHNNMIVVIRMGNSMICSDIWHKLTTVDILKYYCIVINFHELLGE